MNHKLSSIIIIWLSVFHLSAQNITIRKIPSSEQLPVNAIHRIFQDSEGYMWYGTINGLCRDDGYNLKIFRSDLDNPNLLASSDITTITEDKDNKIWFGTFRGAYILDKKTYNIYPLKDTRLQGKKITEMATTSDGSIWVGIAGILLRYDSNENLINEYSLHTNNIPATIQYLTEDKNGNILLSMGGSAIYRINETTHSFELLTKSNVINSGINHFLQDQKRPYLWIGTWGEGIIRFDPTATADSMYIRQPLPVNSKKEKDGCIIRIEQDDVYGYLWVVSYTDLHVFEIAEDGMLKQIDTSTSFPQCNKMLSEIVKDKNGNLWIAAFNQASFIISYQNNAVKEYSMPSLQHYINGNPAITSICKDESGIFWMAQDRTGLCIYSPEKQIVSYYFEYPEIRDLSLTNISQIHKSKEMGKVWVAPFGTEVYGLFQNNMEIKLAERIRLTRSDRNAGAVESLYEDSENNLWIGTTTGLYVYRARNNNLEQIKDITNIVSGITETTDGSIWIATERNGIYKIKGNESPLNFPIEKEILCIDATPDGKLWIGTGEGMVICLNPQSKTTEDYSAVCGMTGDRVYRILVDIFNHVWIYTNQKITEFNPRNGSFRNYSASDEWILLNRFLPRSVSEDEDGTLYFGGIPGFISFRPTHHLESMPQQVKTIITDVEIMGRPLLSFSRSGKGESQTIEIKPNDQNIAIHFSSLNYCDAKKIRYAYRLKGIDNDWVFIGDGKNSAFYNQLNKGKYTFEVKATDENGLWSDQVTQLTIVRLPAFYETWWAYALYALAVLSLVWSMLYLYRRRLKLAGEKELIERVSQLKLRYFTNISHDLMTPLTIISCVVDELKPVDKENEAKIGLLHWNIIRLKRLLQQVLDFRKIESGKMELHVSSGELIGFIRNIYENSFFPLVRKKNMQFSFSSDSDSLNGYFDADKLDKILFNLLSNAFKYTSEGGKIWIHTERLEADDHIYARIQIGDKGIGISKKEQDKIFTRFYSNKHSEAGKSNGIGLSLVKELVELHHGKIQLESQLGEGSVFTVEIPIDKESYHVEELSDRQLIVQPSSNETEQEEKTDYSLLLVEDNEDLLLLMRDVFSKKYHVQTAMNGLEAMKIIKSHRIDIIISDIMMPGINGLELCRTIKNNIETSHILVMLLTAKTQTEDQLSSYDAGADAYIPKPFEMRVVKARLENLLRHKAKVQDEFRKNPEIAITTLEFTSLDEKMLEKAVQVVEKNISEPDFDVEQLAEQLCMSRSTLSRKIKTICGLTPLEFIRNIRMKHAGRLLTDKNVTVAEVTLLLGYSDRRYFTACFKEEFGMTPSEYQKLHEKK